MDPNQIFISASTLEAFASEVFRKAGMEPGNAGYCAQCLVQTNLWGEIEYRNQCQRLKTGIPLPFALVEDLGQLGAKMGVNTPLSPMEYKK